jgi:hypothetical protein
VPPCRYALTIGWLEPSYVIQRFLDAQRIHSLTGYLERLHEGVRLPWRMPWGAPGGAWAPLGHADVAAGCRCLAAGGVWRRRVAVAPAGCVQGCCQFLETPQIFPASPSPLQGHASSDHTTLLLNCYTKLRDVAKLDAFIQGDGSMTKDSLHFDVDTAIKASARLGVVVFGRCGGWWRGLKERGCSAAAALGLRSQPPLQFSQRAVRVAAAVWRPLRRCAGGLATMSTRCTWRWLRRSPKSTWTSCWRTARGGWGCAGGNWVNGSPPPAPGYSPQTQGQHAAQCMHLIYTCVAVSAGAAKCLAFVEVAQLCPTDRLRRTACCAACTACTAAGTARGWSL